MNSPAIVMLASVLVSMSRSGCGEKVVHMANAESVTTADTIALFAAVCKVGERGGDGTLVSPRWVLTAAHVADGMFTRTTGDLRVYFDNGEVRTVQRVFLHPDYEPMGWYDIALLELHSAVSSVVPVPLHTAGNELHGPILLAGHGDRRRPDGTWITDGMLHHYTNRVDEVNGTHIIFDYDAPGDGATEHEGTSGPGDSGGPAFMRTDHGHAVAGVSSMGEPGADGPCSYGAREHFVRVSQFDEWLYAVMDHPDQHQALTMVGRPEVRSESGSGEYEREPKELGRTQPERAARLIIDALGTGQEAALISAINNTYDPEILKHRDAQRIAHNMPALVKELAGAHLVTVLSSSTEKISLKLQNQEMPYVLDIFFTPAGHIEQMAFGRVG